MSSPVCPGALHDPVTSTHVFETTLLSTASLTPQLHPPMRKGLFEILRHHIQTRNAQIQKLAPESSVPVVPTSARLRMGSPKGCWAAGPIERAKRFILRWQGGQGFWGGYASDNPGSRTALPSRDCLTLVQKKLCPHWSLGSLVLFFFGRFWGFWVGVCFPVPRSFSLANLQSFQPSRPFGHQPRVVWKTTASVFFCTS